MSMFTALLLVKKKKKDDWTGLRLTAQEASTVSISLTGSPDISNLKYRKNNGEWSPITAGESISLSTGDYIDYWNESTTLSTSASNYVSFVMTGKIAASGKIMSLLNFADACRISCFRNLFYDCTSLVAAPEFPSTSLASHCYHKTLYGCTSLVAAPELPSTSLASYCYYDMLYGCTSLVAAPELPSTSLVSYCYHRMLYGCKNLNSIEVNFSEWPNYSTSSWVFGVASSGTFTCPSSLPEEYGINRIPEGWTVVRK